MRVAGASAGTSQDGREWFGSGPAYHPSMRTTQTGVTRIAPEVEFERMRRSEAPSPSPDRTEDVNISTSAEDDAEQMQTEQAQSQRGGRGEDRDVEGGEDDDMMG